MRLFHSGGLPAVGLSGADGRIFTGRPLGGILERGDPHRQRRSGSTRAWSELLLGAGFLPVLASTTVDERGPG